MGDELLMFCGGRHWGRRCRAGVLGLLLTTFFACDQSIPERPVTGESPQFPVSELPDSLVFEARGTEFRWAFAYAGADGDLGTHDDVLLGNTLLVPSDREIELRLTSDDYIYILSAPGMGQREIAVPEMTHTLRFNSGPVDEHQLVSDPLCGFRFFHDEIMGRVSVVPADQFVTQLGSVP